MSFPTFAKDPDERLDYKIDWTKLLPSGDTIVASSWETYDPKIVAEDGQFDDTSATIWVRSGEVGAEYLVTNHIETLGGRKEDQSIKVKIKEK